MHKITKADTLIWEIYATQQEIEYRRHYKKFYFQMFKEQIDKIEQLKEKEKQLKTEYHKETHK